MRMSRLVAPTLREDPAEAEVPSHKLMLRAGMIRKLAAGIYNLLPLGYRSISKVIQIVREEMNAAGAQEVFLPALLPRELWDETGRWSVYGKELFRIKDRHDREFCLGPTHEEIITALVRDSVYSYRQLPINLYQIQTKFRDEIRPRFGVMRGREFMMKDAYSFHDNEKSLDEEYKNMFNTYCRIFDRMALKYKVVEADSGAIGGGFSQEFMVLADTGEEEIFYCDNCGYSASRESAGLLAYRTGDGTRSTVHDVTEVQTPNQKTIEEVSAFLRVKPSQMIKTLIYETERGPIAALVRGDHELNEAKLKKLLAIDDLRLAEDKIIQKVTGAPVGFAGPVRLKGVKIVADNVVPEIENGVTGANKADYHLTSVSYGRDYKADQIGDIRYALRSDTCGKCKVGVFEVTRGIEVGHIFKLGTKYSAKMGATYLDEKNQSRPFIMGCYGIGIGRTAAAAIEQSYDKDGIIWPTALAPFQAAIVPVNSSEKEQMQTAEKIYKSLGGEVLLDDRDARVGVKLKDIDLIGIPIKIIVGPKGLKENKVEIKLRITGESKLVDINSAAAEVKKLLK